MKTLAQGSPQHRIRTRVLLVEPDGQKWTSDFQKNTAFIPVQEMPIKRIRGKLFLISNNW